jgi:5,10-methylenetetrahydromethanopterin reductase
LEERLGPYASYPSFRAVLDREGVATGADVAIVGDEDAVARAIERLEDAGGTDFAAVETPGNAEEAARTRALLRRLAAASRPATPAELHS